MNLEWYEKRNSDEYSIDYKCFMDSGLNPSEFAEIYEKFRSDHEKLLILIAQHQGLILEYPEIANHFYRKKFLLPSFNYCSDFFNDGTDLVIFSKLQDFGKAVHPDPCIKHANTDHLVLPVHNILCILKSFYRDKLDYIIEGETELALGFAEIDGRCFDFPEFFIDLAKKHRVKLTWTYHTEGITELILNKNEIQKRESYQYLRNDLDIISEYVQVLVKTVEVRRKNKKIKTLTKRACNNGMAECVLNTHIQKIKEEMPTRSSIYHCVDKLLNKFKRHEKYINIHDYP